jgi:hypothetical protein
VAGPLPLHNFYSILIRLLEPSSSEAGETWVRNMAAEIFAYKASFLCSQGSFTGRKSTTWDRRLYFPCEGSRATDFYHP